MRFSSAKKIKDSSQSSRNCPGVLRVERARRRRSVRWRRPWTSGSKLREEKGGTSRYRMEKACWNWLSKRREQAAPRAP